MSSDKTELPAVTTTFGVSGYLIDSDVLLYDRDGESLWSQLDGRAIAGPRARQRLEFLAVVDTSWGRWKDLHPGARVLRGPLRAREYAGGYAAYHAHDRLMFPVAEHSDALPLKSHVFGVRTADASACWSLDFLEERAAAREQEHRTEPLAWEIDLGDVPLRLTFDPRGRSLAAVRRAAADDPAAPVPVLRLYWFAWYAFHPRTRVNPRIESD